MSLTKNKGKAFFEKLFNGEIPKELINLSVSSVTINIDLAVVPNFITPLIEEEES